MARSTFPLIAPVLSGALVVLTLGPVAILLMVPGPGPALPDLEALRFTLLQAALSALASVALAVPVARALARRRFPSRGAVIAALGAPFLLPAIVAVLGLLAVFGRAGWLNRTLDATGLPTIAIYGLHGVVLAHVFLNMPLAVRLILMGWQSIPSERFRLASTLGFAPAQAFRHLELPMLRSVLPGAALVIFTICLTSFAVALTLGGGPAATTIELAIYQALRFEFDLPAAARLALLQFALCLLAFLAASRLAIPDAFGAGFDRPGGPAASGGLRRIGDAVAIGAACLFIAMPLASIALRGLPGLATLPREVWIAALRSVSMALPVAALTTCAALTLALAHAQGRAFAALAATLPLAASSLVMGTGLFILLRTVVSPMTMALPVTMLVNSMLALPFAFRILAPETQKLQADYGRLVAALGLGPVARLRWLVLPRLARPLGFAAGLSAALAMGDLGVIALFAGDGGATLPLMVQRLMGAYRMDQAAAAALVLVTLSFTLFWAFDATGRHVAA